MKKAKALSCVLVFNTALLCATPHVFATEEYLQATPSIANTEIVESGETVQENAIQATPLQPATSINVDTNGDGIPDLNIDTDGDGIPDTNIDADGDGVIDTEDTTTPPVTEVTPEPDQGAETPLPPEQEQPDNNDQPGSGDPSVTPDVPVTPENPVVPPTPSEPSQPEIPTQPETPSQPQTPQQPETPQQPSEPSGTQPSQGGTPNNGGNTSAESGTTVTTPQQTPSYSGTSEDTDNKSVVYKGAIKKWTGVSKNSKRYQLKKAAEAMLGWSYSQAIRMTDGYRDCSSFVYTAMSDAGFAPPVSWAWTTYTMPSYTNLIEPISMSDLRPGDIILGDGHVAFYWGEDALGWPQTLECCGTYGVCYGYMMCNGWDFPYTSAWRIKGIDGEDASVSETDSSSSYTVRAAKLTSSDSGSEEITGTDDEKGEVLGTHQTENDDTIVITKEKLNGDVIDLLDLDKDAVFTLKMYLDKNLKQKDIENLKDLGEENKVEYLLEKTVEYKAVDAAKVISDYLGEPLPLPAPGEEGVVSPFYSFVDRA